MVKGGRSGQGASTGRVDGGVAALRPGAGVEATGSGWSPPSGWTAPLSRRSRTSMWWPPSGLGAPTSTHPPIAMDAIEGSGCRHRRRGAPGFPLTWAEVKGKRQGHGRWSRGGTEAGQGGGEPAQCRWARAAGGRRQQMLAGGRLGVWHAPLHLPPTLRAAFRFGLSRPGGAHCVGGRLGVAPLGLAGRWTTPDGAAGTPSGGHQGVRGAPDGVHPPLCGWTPAPVAHSGPLDWMEYIEWMGRPHRGVLGSIRTQASRCAVHPHFGPLRWTPPRGRAEAPDPHHPCTVFRPPRCSPGRNAGFPLDLGRGQGETAGPRPVVKGWNGGRSRGWGNLREAGGQGGERAEGL